MTRFPDVSVLIRAARSAQGRRGEQRRQAQAHGKQVTCGRAGGSRLLPCPLHLDLALARSGKVGTGPVYLTASHPGQGGRCRESPAGKKEMGEALSSPASH